MLKSTRKTSPTILSRNVNQFYFLEPRRSWTQSCKLLEQRCNRSSISTVGWGIASMHRPTFAYMAYNLCRTIYKIWPSTTAWLTLPYETLQERFNTGARYDALGSWPASLCATDPETNISKEISDEEVKASCAEVRGNIEDPDGRWLIKKLRANQILSALIRGANQLGYSRQSFNPQTYIDRGQGPKEMHFSCLGLLNELIPKVTGYTMYSLIRPAQRRTCTSILWVSCSS